MKKIVALACLVSFTMAAQNNEKACNIFAKISSTLQTKHFKPKPIDDSLSVYVFNTVMENLDDSRILFLQEDYDKLAKHKYRIDDYINNKDCSFFTDFINVYKMALERNKKNIQELGKQQLLSNSADTLFYSKQSFPYHKDPAKIKNFLRKKLIHGILEDVAKLSQNKDSLKANLPKLSKESQQKVVESYLCRTDSQLSPPEGFDNNIYNKFFSVFCSYYDPHSTYFSYNDKASFMSSISTENYSLGLVVTQNDKEEIIVDEIVPGGPAYRSNKVTKGDQLLQIKADGKEYSINCASLEAISNIVFSDTYKTVGLTLRKKDGSVYTVNLEKTVMKAEDHSVYSFILGEGENKVGYIKIPSFYTAEDNSIKGCADDVAKEITKLKKDNVKGLILDLQNNGGGSMDEVIKLSGMFIDIGPLAVLTDTRNSYNTVKDYNRGTLYNGPLVVLVNGFSASASEFFAGVMQDYNRAIIAGSTTLGKATMQTIVPLDEDNQQDFVKVTVDKFYRVTGKSSQYKGIEPDVEMPVFFEKLLPRESSMPTAMRNDSIDQAQKFKPLPKEPVIQAAELSKKRIDKSADFANVKALNNKVNDILLKDKKPLPLTFDAVFADVHSMDAIWKDISTASEKQQQFAISNTSFSNEVQKYDEYLKNASEHKMKLVKNDPYINEGINILNDLNNLTNN
jgi:carboxyl-terminal processing protease